jgi:hypothetical protein
MSEQRPEQVAQQTPEQNWRRPGSGISGNPHGRASPRVRARAKTEDFVIDFRAKYGREPTRAEHGRLHKAAILEVDAERAGNQFDRARSSNSSEKILRSLGLDRVMRTTTNGSQSGRSLLSQRGDSGHPDLIDRLATEERGK